MTTITLISGESRDLTMTATDPDTGSALDISSGYTTGLKIAPRGDLLAVLVLVHADIDVATEGVSGVAIASITSAQTAGLAPGDYVGQWTLTENATSKIELEQFGLRITRGVE